MTAQRNFNSVLAVLCLLALTVWFYYWLFVASRDSGKTTATVFRPGMPPQTVTKYDPGQRYEPFIPLVIVGVVSSVVAAVAALLLLRKPSIGFPFHALTFAPMAAVIILLVLIAVRLAFDPDVAMPGATERQLASAVAATFVVYSLGIAIFAAIPALLAAAAVCFWRRRTVSPHALLKSGERTESEKCSPRIQDTCE